MAVNADNPTVPTTCDDFALPADVSVVDCYTPALNFGPGINLFWGTEPFSATPTANSIAAAITAGTLIGPIVGEYTRAAGGNDTIRVNSRTVSIPGEKSWTVKISDTALVFREMSRQTQNGGVSGHFYILDRNGQWFGGINGVCATNDGGPAVLQLRQLIPAGEQEPQTIEGTITGFTKYDDKVIPSPVPAIY